MNIKNRFGKLLGLTLSVLALVVGLDAIATSVSAQSPTSVQRSAPQRGSSGVEVMDIVIPFGEGHDFDSIMSEASTNARNMIEQGFAANPNAREVIINIMGGRNGEVVPLMIVRVGREDWQSNPRVEQWSRYMGNSAVGFLAYGDDRPTALPSGPLPNVPLSTGTREDYVIPGASIEESDPGYR